MTSIERRPLAAGALGVVWPSGLHPVLQQVLARRRLASAAELDLALAALVPVSRFTELDAAVELMLAHRGKRILIVGDFDADGATSTALMWLTLRDLGFERVAYRIPDRFRVGDSLSDPLSRPPHSLSRT
jgi:single-stranded-DNA-specific exonuclease